MEWYEGRLSDLTEKLQTDTACGIDPLSYAGRIKKYGRNEIEHRRTKAPAAQILKLALRPFIILCLAAAAVLLFFNGKADPLTAAAALSAAAADFIMAARRAAYARAVKKRLRRLLSAAVTVIRGGKSTLTEAANIVPGDLISLKKGDVVPADARIVFCSGLICDESAVFGKGRNAEKSAVPDPAGGPRADMLYCGAGVTEGTATAIVVLTGRSVMIANRGAGSAEPVRKTSPLRRSMGACAALAAVISSVCCAVLAALPLILKNSARTLGPALVFAAAALIFEPRGELEPQLCAAAEKIADKGIVLRDPADAEKLADLSVICTDIGGLLRSHTKKIVSIWTPDTGVVPVGQAEESSLFALRIAALACGFGARTAWELHDEAERAVLDEAARRFDAAETAGKFSYKGSVTAGGGVKCGVVSTGNRRFLTVFCERSRAVELLRDPITAFVGELAEEREVYAVAARRSDGRSDSSQIGGFVLMGMFVMKTVKDEELAGLAGRLEKRGITPVILTSEPAERAQVCGVQAGVLIPGGRAVSGANIEEANDDYLKELILNNRVFCELDMRQKLRIIKAYRAIGETVAAAGSSNSDRRLFETADIGIALSRASGVAKASAPAVCTRRLCDCAEEAADTARLAVRNIKSRALYGFCAGVCACVSGAVCTALGAAPAFLGTALICAAAVKYVLAPAFRFQPDRKRKQDGYLQIGLRFSRAERGYTAVMTVYTAAAAAAGGYFLGQRVYTAALCAGISLLAPCFAASGSLFRGRTGKNRRLSAEAFCGAALGAAASALCAGTPAASIAAAALVAGTLAVSEAARLSLREHGA